jgi:hypothetical protein
MAEIDDTSSDTDDNMNDNMDNNTSGVDDIETGDIADEAPIEDLPNTSVEVHTHINFGMTGSFPLRLAELFFADDGIYIVEYGYITPLFGLGARKHRREAKAMKAVYDRHGLDEVLVQGDSVTWLNYATVTQVTLYDGGRLGRPKIAVQPENGPSHAYRLHDSIFEELAFSVEEVCERYDVTVEKNAGIGFSPSESLRRFFNRV